MRKADWIAGTVGSVMLLAAAAVFGVTHYNALLHARANQVAANDEEQQGLKFPTIDEMCKAAGVAAADMQSCLSDETSAAEFVGAWMEYNGFLNNGRIDIEQIQSQAELAVADPTISTPAGDPLADPLPDGDPAQGLLAASPDADPLAPSADQAMPPAQVALSCLSTAADDWLKMHDCITHSDPSSTLDGN
jgi:hypothetical protein